MSKIKALFITLVGVCILGGAGYLLLSGVVSVQRPAKVEVEIEREFLQPPPPTTPDYMIKYGDQTPTKGKTRTASSYYQRRAYSGAPPTIPHPLENESAYGGESCLKCHERGGFVSKYNAYAPLTPHPGYSSCTQCHTLDNNPKQATQNSFAGLKPEKTGPTPVMMPHTTEMRTNCRACHTGPASMSAIRRDHEERGECLQCHVPKPSRGVMASANE